MVAVPYGFVMTYGYVMAYGSVVTYDTIKGLPLVTPEKRRFSGFLYGG